jgi:hypothetical protein
LTATTTLLAFVTALISLASFQVFARTASQHFNPDDFENNDHKGDMSSLVSLLTITVEVTVLSTVTLLE